MNYPLELLKPEYPEPAQSSPLLKALEEDPFQHTTFQLPIVIGEDENQKSVTADIISLPHLLILGASGTGKSMFLRSLIMGLLYHISPDRAKMIIVDTKIIEFNSLNGLPHLLVPVIHDPLKAVGALNWLQSEILQRLKLFASLTVRDIESCNSLLSSRNQTAIPRIVLVIDELTDIMNTDPKETEGILLRLSQSGRATGIHLIVSTFSRRSITNSMKAAFPSKLSFSVSSNTDSKSILGTAGAEKLRGLGEMLFNPLGSARPIKLQGYYLGDRDMDSILSYMNNNSTSIYDASICDEVDRHFIRNNAQSIEDDLDDELLPQAIECVVEAGHASTSTLQRRLKLGYARAARLIDQLEQRGIVGPFEGSKPRQVLISKERWMDMKLSGQEEKLIK